MCESKSAVKVSIEVQVAIMSRPPRVLPATVPQPKLVAMEGSGNKF